MTAVTPRLSQRPVSRTPNKDEVEEPFWPLFLKRANVSAAILPLCLKSVVIATLSLYLLNQKHLLPKHLSQVVSKVLFWPTLPITISKRLGSWITQVDDTVLIGGVPYLGYPEKLAKKDVRGVVNLCDEYRGPIGAYKRLGIEQLYLPTVDHFEPEVESLKSAVSFIQEHESKGNKVYVHCKAGHGRSAAVVMAWLLYKEPLADPQDLNEKLCSLRDVRKSLWKQTNVNIYLEWLKEGGMTDGESEEDDRNNRHRKRGKTSTKKDVSEGEEDSFAFGQVFSDEDESSWTDESDFDFSDGADASDFEDERGYDIWRH